MAAGSLAAIQAESDGPVSEVNRRCRILSGHDCPCCCHRHRQRADDAFSGKVHGSGRPGSRRSGGGGSSAASFLTFSNSACASCIAAQRTPQPAQPVMRVRLGRVDPDRLAKMAGRLAGIVLCGEKDTEIQMCEPDVRIQGQRASKVRLGRLFPIQCAFPRRRGRPRLARAAADLASSASNSRRASS